MLSTEVMLLQKSLMRKKSSKLRSRMNLMCEPWFILFSSGHYLENGHLNGGQFAPIIERLKYNTLNNSLT